MDLAVSQGAETRLYANRGAKPLQGLVARAVREPDAVVCVMRLKYAQGG
jgi:hypothetical protein